MRLGTSLAGLAISLLFLLSPTKAQEEWLVATDHARCLIDHAEDYSATGQDVLMIVLSACPEADIEKAMASLTMNSAVPGIGVETEDNVGVDNVIVYTREELACLASLKIDLTGPVSRLPKVPGC